MIPDIHKTVIVTGASQGIGASLAKAFLDRRYNVVATSRSISKTGGFKASDKLELVESPARFACISVRPFHTAHSKQTRQQNVAKNAMINDAMSAIVKLLL